MDNQGDPQNTNLLDQNSAPAADTSSGSVQQDQGNVSWPPAQDSQVAQQGIAQSYNEPQQMAQQPQQPQQPVSISPSPEVPARLETSGESVPVPELGQESTEKQVEQQAEKVKDKKEASVEAPKEAPDQKKFESPFNVYGYKVSSQISDASKSATSQKVARDTNSSKTWLVILLDRLLKMYKQEDSLNTADK
jgi:hypothetical protein